MILYRSLSPTPNARAKIDRGLRNARVVGQRRLIRMPPWIAVRARRRPTSHNLGQQAGHHTPPLDTTRSLVMRKHLFYRKVERPASQEPVIDNITRKTAGIFLQYASRRPCMGWYVCTCGALSDAHDYILPNGAMTHSLCVHYVAYHREELSKSDLDAIATLDIEGVDPPEELLAGPGRTATAMR